MRVLEKLEISLFLEKINLGGKILKGKRENFSPGKIFLTGVRLGIKGKKGKISPSQDDPKPQKKGGKFSSKKREKREKSGKSAKIAKMPKMMIFPFLINFFIFIILIIFDSLMSIEVWYRRSSHPQIPKSMILGYGKFPFCMKFTHMTHPQIEKFPLFHYSYIPR